MQTLQPYKVRPATSELPGSFETGTQSHEGMAGTTAAVNYFAWIGKEFADQFQKEHTFDRQRTKYVHAALDYLFEYEKLLTLYLIEGLSNIKKIKIQGITQSDAMDKRLPTVSFSVDGIHPEEIAKELGKNNIFVWSGHSYAIEVVKTLGLYEKGGVIRTGPVHYNSIEEIREFLKILESILATKK